MPACVNREDFPHSEKTVWEGNENTQPAESTCVVHVYTMYVYDECGYTWGLSPLVEITPWSLVCGKEANPQACSAKKQCSLTG